ncbi:unnamed protein product [Symbiodinium sp. CCMP2456]|nr:unnamed protein product [Symbiodinium sp. CCMP2456]
MTSRFSPGSLKHRLRELGRGSQWPQALALLLSTVVAAMPSKDADEVTFSAAQSALEAGRQWQRSLDLFAFMPDAKISPGLMSYSAALSACQKGAQWQQALQLRQEFLSSRIRSDVIPHNACISACAKPARWDLALAVFRSLPTMQLAPSLVSYSAMITCLEKGWQWRMVVELLEELGRSDLIMSADVVIFSAAISALEKGLQWQSALKTFGIMANKSILPNAICYNATMSACQAGDAWQSALHLFQMQTSMGSADLVSYTIALQACAISRRWQEAVRLHQSLPKMQIAPDPVACVAVLEALSHHGLGYKLLRAAFSRPAARRHRPCSSCKESPERFIAVQWWLAAAFPQLDHHSLDEFSFNTTVRWNCAAAKQERQRFMHAEWDGQSR